jgi:hypothetical protein
VIGGSPGICTTVEPTPGGIPGSGGGGGGPPGGGSGFGDGGGAGGTPLLTTRVTMIPGIVWPLGDVPTTVPDDALLLTIDTPSAT